MDSDKALCPIHATFLVCYCIFLVDVILFAILSEHVKNTLKRVMRKCLRDLREMLKRRAIGWSVQILLIPFKHCGIFGCFFRMVVLYSSDTYCSLDISILLFSNN